MDETTAVYEKRQREQDLRKKYLALANEVTLDADFYRINPNYSIRLPNDAHIQVMDDGAFVEMTIWIPREHVK